VLLFTGLIVGGVMFVSSRQRHDKTVEAFARAGVGCTTTLKFSETGEFFVFEETGTPIEVLDEVGCQPLATPGQPFGFEISGPADVPVRADSSITYEIDELTGASVATFEIETDGLYKIAVVGSDVSTVAAVGRDPSSGVSQLRRGAIVVAAAGLLLGGLLLGLAGTRSKRAATPSIPDGPGWGDRPKPEDAAWPPLPPRVPQVPVNPQQPDVPAAVAAPPPPLPARAPGSAAPSRSPWAPPLPGDSPVDTSPPGRVPDVKAPELPPVLPD